ncbi:hypothetical protein DL96DRAFT_1623449 [Flagelloscypha sp. PMI_526]|nr:hypothetical protein DL96DRAFT_1623449 [Flagelloscypha sp. PMI_526]
MIQHICKILQQNTALTADQQNSAGMPSQPPQLQKPLIFYFIPSTTTETTMPPPLHSRDYYYDNNDDGPNFPYWGGIVIAFILFSLVILFFTLRARRSRTRRIQAEVTVLSNVSRSNTLPAPPPPYPGHAGSNPALYGYPIPTAPAPTYDPSTPGNDGGHSNHHHHGGPGAEPASGQTSSGTTGGAPNSGGGLNSSGGGTGGDSGGGPGSGGTS